MYQLEVTRILANLLLFIQFISPLFSSEMQWRLLDVIHDHEQM